LEIGKLNQRITILENRTVIDEIGNHTAKWEEIFSCWACVSVKTSTESDDAGVSKEVQTVQFIIRQNFQTVRLSTTVNRILFRNLEYNITGIMPDFVRNDYLKITATTRKAGVPDDIY
jgi:SPP1 family predicted phage head-tail adaptor